jgi:hypothetical protein
LGDSSTNGSCRRGLALAATSWHTVITPILVLDAAIAASNSTLGSGWSMIRGSKTENINNQDWIVKVPTSPALYYTSGSPCLNDDPLTYVTTSSVSSWTFVSTNLSSTSSGSVILTTSINNYLALVIFPSRIPFDRVNGSATPQGRRIYWSLARQATPGELFATTPAVNQIMKSLLYLLTSRESLKSSRIRVKVPVVTGSNSNNNTFTIKSSWSSLTEYCVTVRPPNGIELLSSSVIVFPVNSSQQQVQFRSTSSIPVTLAYFRFGMVTSNDPSLFGLIPSPLLVEIVSLASFTIGASITAGNTCLSRLHHFCPMMIKWFFQ